MSGRPEWSRHLSWAWSHFDWCLYKVKLSLTLWSEGKFDTDISLVALVECMRIDQPVAIIYLRKPKGVLSCKWIFSHKLLLAGQWPLILKDGRAPTQSGFS